MIHSSSPSAAGSILGYAVHAGPPFRPGQVAAVVHQGKRLALAKRQRLRVGLPCVGDAGMAKLLRCDWLARNGLSRHQHEQLARGEPDPVAARGAARLAKLHRVAPRCAEVIAAGEVDAPGFGGGEEEERARPADYKRLIGRTTSPTSHQRRRPGRLQGGEGRLPGLLRTSDKQPRARVQEPRIRRHPNLESVASWQPSCP